MIHRSARSAACLLALVGTLVLSLQVARAAYPERYITILCASGAGGRVSSAPSGRVRLGLPCLEELSAKLTKRGVKKALLRAELYLRETVDGRRCASADVPARSST